MLPTLQHEAREQWPSFAFFSSLANASSPLPSTGRAWLSKEDMKLIMEMKVGAMKAVLGQTKKQGKCLSGFVDDGSVESRRYYLLRRTVLGRLGGILIKATDFDMPSSSS